MTQYIDKDALIAEIKRRIESCAKQREDMLNLQCHTLADDASARMGELNCIQNFIDNLEVKEVDSLTPEEIKKICIIYDNLNQERKCATVLYNSDETFFNHVLMEYKSITQKGE